MRPSLRHAFLRWLATVTTMALVALVPTCLLAQDAPLVLPLPTLAPRTAVTRGWCGLTPDRLAGLQIATYVAPDDSAARQRVLLLFPRGQKALNGPIVVQRGVIAGSGFAAAQTYCAGWWYRVSPTGSAPVRYDVRAMSPVTGAIGTAVVWSATEATLAADLNLARVLRALALTPLPAAP